VPSYTLVFEMNGKTAPFTSIDVDGTDTRDWSLIALDCDGDGKMELLLTTAGNAASMELYEVRQGKPKLMLAIPPD